MKERPSKLAKKKAVKPPPQTDWFSVERANRAVPLVSRIVRDIKRTVAELQEVLEAGRRAGDHAQDLAARRTQLGQKLTAYLDELEHIGCDLKDLRLGLVDFPAMHDGREVCLCWKEDETLVEWWHDCDSGYSGRRPIVNGELT